VIAISEKVSETDEDARPGRPRLIGEQYASWLQAEGWWRKGETRRTVLNKYRMMKALEVLIEEDPDLSEFAWLCDNETGRTQRTILYELGRIEDREALLEVARELCASQPRTQEGVQTIRRVRRVLKGEEVAPAGDALALANELIETLNGYLGRYPDTTTDEQLTSIRTVEAVIRNARTPSKALP
jgi:hypothetical protein